MSPQPSLFLRLLLLLLLAFMAGMPTARAQGDQSIYADSLQNGWQNYGWATLNYSNTSPVHSGSDSISVTAAAYQALYVYHPDFDSSPYTALTFWINGGPTGGQPIQVQALVNNSAQTVYQLPTLAANTWQQVTIPLSALGAAGQSDLDGFWFKNSSGSTLPTFYIDDITLTAAPLPTSAHLSVNAGQAIRTLDGRVYGLNTAIWDGNLGTQTSVSLLGQMQTQILRFPGGSASDAYNWSTNRSDGNTFTWSSSFATFAALASSTQAQACLTVDYGSGTPEMAAAWVAYANGSPSSTQTIGVDAYGRDWKTVGAWATLRASMPLSTDDGYNFLRVGRSAPYGFHEWEIGNECYGSWENDQHGVAQSNGATPLAGFQWDPYTYAQYAAQFSQKMKAVDPTIKVGVVGIDGEDTNSNTRHSVPNPNENGSLHSGWTPVVLATLKSLGVTPDFLIYHRYPEAPGGESDYNLLVDSATGWPAAATSLRQMLTDYLGAPGAGVELMATENNSVYGNPGKQSVSLVNGLYLADSIGSLAQTEFNGLMWWDFRNGSLTNDNNSSTLYGWRQFGDYGIVATGDRSDTPTNTPYPAFYAAKLLTHWARGGDRVVPASTGDKRLAIYAARLQNGSLALLVINKDAKNDLTGHLGLTGFNPGSATATVYQYGKPQDLADADLTQSTITNAGTAFDYLFPSYSMTVIILAGPAAVAAPPTVASAATATPNPVVGTKAALSVLGADAQGEASLTYTWTATGSAPVTFTPNATNAAKAATATFAAAGAYTLTATVTDPAGLSAQSSVNVTVLQTPAAIAVKPAAVTLTPGATQSFTATITDQFGAPITSPTVAWSTKGGGAITSAGQYTAGTSPGGPFAVTATLGNVQGAAAVTIVASVNASTFVTQNVPSTMMAGQVYPVSVTFTNTGTTTWTSAAAYHLGSQSPQDNQTWGFNRVLLPNSVAPGQSVIVTFNVTAPSTAGTYPFQWRLVQDGVQWFGDFTTAQSVVVTSGTAPAPSPGNASLFVSQTLPSTMTAGQVYPVTVTMQNRGTTTWTSATAYHLGSQNPQDNQTWGLGRAFLPNSVAPGQSVAVTFNVTAPATTGTYPFQWRMVQDGVQWFGDFTPSASIIVH